MNHSHLAVARAAAPPDLGRRRRARSQPLDLDRTVAYRFVLINKTLTCGSHASGLNKPRALAESLTSGSPPSDFSTLSTLDIKLNLNSI